jgi:hypothetical protein
MASSNTPVHSAIKIEERDQSQKLVAVYVRSPEAGDDDKSRIDVIVSTSDTPLSPALYFTFIFEIDKVLMVDCET